MKVLDTIHASDEPEEEPEAEEEEEEEEELEDIHDHLRAKCREDNCSKYQEKLDTCNDRVNSRTKTSEDCTEEIMDLFHCVDYCAAKTLFSKLK
ncbi:cytochrome b-c1 complex subunit 6, mitochondrial [Octopus bimaculoides]|uniref:Cytochrome b-c1 complex subunit 6 n=1 Tax=Octopus bimaculoides TaxID=37653 RepID=A0A0L8GRU3_OCTBM|nr:cytochrome b-c1 complex subunit 6, mitochondrial [Octopus bimaculoides]|eukprot:XP_014778894.1 PREDICTED: cytochrome b-c1 complex subunit 6, mitochondrial-like [Octopus bimaculoides]